MKVTPTEDRAPEHLSRLAAIVESSEDAIIGKDLNGIITSWNKGAEIIFGYTADEMIGTSILRLFPEDRQAEEDYILGKIRRGEKVERLETVRRTKDGRLIDVSLTSSPIKNAAGQIVGASKIARDITSRKAHEEEILRLSRLYTALSQINQAIVWTRERGPLFEKICHVLVELGKFSMAWIGEADGKTRRINPVAKWGDDTDYLSQAKIYVDARPEGLGPVGRAIREGQSYICNDFAQDPNTAPWHELADRAGFSAMAALPIRQNGTVWGAVMVYSHERGFFRDKEIALLEEAAGDISFALDYLSQDEQRREAEVRLRENEERYEALFDRSLNCVFLSDFEGQLLDANQAALDLLGYQRKDLASLTFASLLTDDQLPLAMQVTEEIKRTGRQKQPTEFRLRGKDGRQIDVESQASLLYRAGKPFAILGIARDITARKQAEGQIAQLAERQTAIINALPAHLALLDTNGVIMQVNDAWRRFAVANALPGSDFAVGQSYLEVCRQAHGEHAEESHAVAAGLQRVLRGEAKEFVLEYPCHAPNEQRWFQLTASPLSEAEQAGAVVMHMDITARKRAEEALAKSEQDFRELVQNMPIALVEHGPDTAVLFANQMASRLLGLSLDQMLGKTATDPTWHFTGEDGTPMPLADYPVNRTLQAAHGTVSNLILGIQRPGQEEKTWVLCNGQSFRSEDGNIQKVVVTFTDQTERRRIESANAQLATAVEQSADSIIITDANGIIVYVNRAFEKISGYTHPEVLGRPPSILKSGKHDADFYRQMWDTLKSGAAWQGHILNLGKHGKLYEVEATISPVRDASGALVNFVAAQRDVTREQQLEAQFRQSQKMEAFGQLAGGVAHDFNNILAVIQMQAEILKSESNLSLRQLGFARDIEKAAQRAADLTRQLLLFSRKQIMQPHHLLLKEAVDGMTKILKRTLGEQFELRFHLASEPIVVHADPGMIDQILLNLVVNARDAMPRGGKIVIETSAVELDEASAAQTIHARPGAFACLSVSDTGCGIPHEILPRIFEPFFTTKEVGRGTGLGLATVFGIVQQHRGWINVYSEVGRGTTFRIYLPRMDQVSDIKPTRQSRPPMAGHDETLLLVEDDPDVRAALCFALLQLGYRVLEAANSEEALTLWNQHRGEIRLLLTDLVMPGKMTGVELARQLVQQKPQLRVIYTSGYSAEVAGKELVLEEGVNFLSKPFKSNQLAQTIRDQLDSAAGPA